MGLDLVELVFEIEETFGIVFDDLEAEKIGTVGQAYRYILSQLELRQTIPCPSASLFYKLRRALMARSVVDRREVHPSARIADFLPQNGRREAWIGLGDEVGMTMPRLEFGNGLELATWLVGLGLVLGMVAVGRTLGTISEQDMVPALLVLGTISLFGTVLIFRQFASQIPSDCETIRGTIETILGRRMLALEAQGWNPEEVWFTLRDLISEQAGVASDFVTEEKSFGHDLGMD
jgi:acyl carrier protein